MKKKPIQMDLYGYGFIVTIDNYGCYDAEPVDESTPEHIIEYSKSAKFQEDMEKQENL